MDKLVNYNGSWWNSIDIVKSSRSFEQAVVYSLLSMAIKDNLCVYDHAADGNPLIPLSQFLDKVESLGGRCVSKAIKGDAKTSSDYIYVWDDAMLTITSDESDWVYLKISALNRDLVEKIKNISDKNITQKTRGRAYVFVSGESGPELRQISGVAGIELERDNYTSSVLKAYDHVIRDLQSPTPCGRLVIADGEPGTGKTFLVRGITNAVDGATFVLVDPSMISSMMSPQFIPVLMDHHREKQPIVFIIEDADSCLVEREADNMNSISSLLNLGAGIFGDLFDIRIICTTNAKKIDMDKAIIRKGRTCRYIHTEQLPKEQAERVFKRLLNGRKKSLTVDGKYYTLSDIYDAAREDGWGDEERVEVKQYAKGIGFGST